MNWCLWQKNLSRNISENIDIDFFLIFLWNIGTLQDSYNSKKCVESLLKVKKSLGKFLRGRKQSFYSPEIILKVRFKKNVRSNDNFMARSRIPKERHTFLGKIELTVPLFSRNVCQPFGMRLLWDGSVSRSNLALIRELAIKLSLLRTFLFSHLKHDFRRAEGLLSPATKFS